LVTSVIFEVALPTNISCFVCSTPANYVVIIYIYIVPVGHHPKYGYKISKRVEPSCFCHPHFLEVSSNFAQNVHMLKPPSCVFSPGHIVTFLGAFLQRLSQTPEVLGPILQGFIDHFLGQISEFGAAW
jgi:hypothetical protein